MTQAFLHRSCSFESSVAFVLLFLMVRHGDCRVQSQQRQALKEGTGVSLSRLLQEGNNEDLCGEGVPCRNDQFKVVERYMECFGEGAEGDDSGQNDKKRKKEIKKRCRKEFKRSYGQLVDSCDFEDFFADSLEVPTGAKALKKAYRKREKALTNAGNSCLKTSIFITEQADCAIDVLLSLVCGQTTTEQTTGGTQECDDDVYRCFDGTTKERLPELNCEFEPCNDENGIVTPVEPCGKDVLVCPDGSRLPRDPSLDCDFPPCPTDDE